MSILIFNAETLAICQSPLQMYSAIRLPFLVPGARFHLQVSQAFTCTTTIIIFACDSLIIILIARFCELPYLFSHSFRTHDLYVAFAQHYAMMPKDASRFGLATNIVPTNTVD